MKRRIGVVALGLGLTLIPAGWAQPSARQIVTVEQPDAQRTKEEFSNLMQRDPPSLVMVSHPKEVVGIAGVAAAGKK